MKQFIRCTVVTAFAGLIGVVGCRGAEEPRALPMTCLAMCKGIGDDPDCEYVGRAYCFPELFYVPNCENACNHLASSEKPGPCKDARERYYGCVNTYTIEQVCKPFRTSKFLEIEQACIKQAREADAACGGGEMAEYNALLGKIRTEKCSPP